MPDTGVYSSPTRIQPVRVEQKLEKAPTAEDIIGLIKKFERHLTREETLKILSAVSDRCYSGEFDAAYQNLEHYRSVQSRR